MLEAVTRPRIGLLLYHWESIDGAPAPRWAEIQAMARAAEDAGVDSLWFIDHLLLDRREMFLDRTVEAQPDVVAGPPFGIREGWSLLAALAAVTERVELGHLVICNSFRNPALLAKMADTVDEISGGRLILGLGAGWHDYEYRAFGYPVDYRVARFEEGLQIIHGLLRNGAIDFEGTHYTARDCEPQPRGPRRAGPPIPVGTESPRMLRLTARYADLWNGWIPYTRSHPDLVAPRRAAVDAACAEVGRDPGSLVRTLGIAIRFPGPAPRFYDVGEPLQGSSEEIAAAFWAFADEGIEHLMLVVDGDRGIATDEIGRVIELMDRGR